MMKLRNLMQVACMATAALTAFSCSQEEFENSGRKGNITVNATFEGAGTDTSTTVNDEYKILWQDTDALGLFCSNAESNYSNTKLEYASGAGQTSATFNGSKPSGETAVFSIYPYQQNMSVSGNNLESSGLCRNLVTVSFIMAAMCLKDRALRLSGFVTLAIH